VGLLHSRAEPRRDLWSVLRSRSSACPAGFTALPERPPRPRAGTGAGWSAQSSDETA